jgi:pyrroloquinoline quinone biosynthesis protein D
MNSLERLSHAPDAQVEEMDGGALLYKFGEAQALSLNETALLIWKLCDGSRTADDIVGFLSGHYPDNAKEIATQVAETIQNLLEGKALVASDASSAA